MKYSLITMCFLAFGTLMFQGCGDDIIDPPKEPDFYSKQGAIVSVTDVVNGFYDLADLDNATVGFTMSTKGEAVNSVTVYKSFNGGDRVEHSTESSLPATLSIPIDDAVNGLGVTVEELEIGDVITYSFSTNTPSGTYRSGGTLDAVMSCSSDLAGTYDVVTIPSGSWCDNSLRYEGTSEWYEISAGVYGIVDFAFGSYEICYGPGSALPDGSLAITDVCNEISISGTSQWGEVYTWAITDISGSDMTIRWSNDYGEEGVSTLTRTDGTNWPPLEVK